jgi:hypothetical protein
MSEDNRTTATNLTNTVKNVLRTVKRTTGNDENADNEGNDPQK